MNTINGSLGIRIIGDKVCITVVDCDTPARATAELSRENVKPMCARLNEALILLSDTDQYLEQP